MIARQTAASLLACGLLVSPFGAGAAPALDDATLVRIGEEHVSLEEFLRYLEIISPGTDFRTLPEAQQRARIDEFVERKLFALRAREAGLEQDADTRAKVEFFTDGVLADAMKRSVLAAIDVTDDDISAYYRAHREEFRVPPRLLLEHVIYRQIQSAERARERLLGDDGYAALASENEPNLIYKRRGWLTPDLLIRELVDAARALGPGDVSDVVESAYGFHVMRLHEREPPRYRQPDEVSDEITDRIRHERAGERNADVLADTRRQHDVTINLGRLRAQGILAPRASGATPTAPPE